ncbi:MAG: hypothetical protein RJA99_4879 [Pseudomonadota bacterium]|jgi:hypothetical protein
MTKLAHGARSLASYATALGVGQHALRLSRQIAGARKRLAAKALFRTDVELSGFAQAAGGDPWQAELPLPEQVLREARDVLRLLPGTLPEPLVTRDDVDGGLVFEWAGDNARSLKVRIGGDGMLTYTARLGLRRRIAGAEPIGDALSPLLREAIQQVASAA